MWGPAPLAGVPPQRGEAGGDHHRSTGRPRQGPQWDGHLAGAHGAAALQEAAKKDVGAERLAAPLQRDLPLLETPSLGTGQDGHQVPAVRAGRKGFT